MAEFEKEEMEERDVFITSKIEEHSIYYVKIADKISYKNQPDFSSIHAHKFLHIKNRYSDL